MSTQPKTLDRHIIGDRRYAERHALALELRARIDGIEQPVRIRDLSLEGFLAEVPAGTRRNTVIELELPELGFRQARVAWTGNRLAGCIFEGQLSRATLSAARLRGRLQPAPAPDQGTAFIPAAADREDRAVEKLPMRMRLLIIVGAAALLWAIPILLAVALFA